MATQLNNKIKTFGSRIYDQCCYAMILAPLLFVPNAHAQTTTGLDGMIDKVKTILFDLGSVAVLVFKTFVVLGAAYMIIAGLLEARSKKDGWGDFFMTAVMVILGAVLAYYLIDLADQALENLKSGV